MKTILIFLMVTSFMTIDVSAADGSKHSKNINKNEERDCLVIATKDSWKESRMIQGLKVKSGTFVVTIPSDVIWVGLGTTVTVFRYDKAPHVVIGTENRNTLQLGSNDISMSHALEIVFTKTPKDRKLLKKINRELWDKLMSVKKGLLGKAGKSYLYEKASLTVYFIPDAGEPFNNIAWVVDADNPNCALRIESNMDAGKFKDILFSIKTKEN